MNRDKRSITIIAILILGLAVNYGLPKAKYSSPKMLSKIEIPMRIYSWIGKDVSKELNLNDQRYSFISDALARTYSNKYGGNLLLIILDAGNFHHPKVCFSGAGYTAREAEDIEFTVKSGLKFKAKAVFFEKRDASCLVIYWLCINKEVTNWTGQKIKELWYSIVGKKKTGLMVRLDIPVNRDNIKSAIKTAKEFVDDLSRNIPPDQSEYLFGK